MIDLATPLLGPLAAPECRRAARRPWSIVARSISGAIASTLAFVTVWTWWISAQVDPNHLPYTELRVALLGLIGMGVVVALVLTPAFLAGSLAGEKERGSIGLLLATDATARDIVFGRLAAGLGQILMIGLATVPLLIGIAALAGFGPANLATMMLLPAAVAFGAGGIAVGTSAISRRGRDALMLVYLVIVLTQFAPLLGTVGVVNPFAGMGVLVWEEDPTVALLCSGIWVVAGALGVALASWRLRPAALSEGKDDRARRRSQHRGRRVPEVDEARPMLWKERYVERAGNLGVIGRWFGGAIVVWLISGSLFLGGVAARAYFTLGDLAKAQWATDLLYQWYTEPAGAIVALILAAIGLRSAVTIASERERGTWDGLLTSPLEGNEIILGKLIGSLGAVRWLAGAAVLAWTIALVAGVMPVKNYLDKMASLATLGVFIAALGVRVSLQAPTATKSMGLTLGLALVAVVCVSIFAGLFCALVALVCWLGWLVLGQLGIINVTVTSPWFPMSMEVGFLVVRAVTYAVAASAMVTETRLRFDRIGGRMTAGRAAVAVDRFIHGGPLRPVRLEPARDDDIVYVEPAPMP